jgi:hypothetical protein
MATFAIVAALAILVALPVGIALAQAEENGVAQVGGSPPINLAVTEAESGVTLNWDEPETLAKDTQPTPEDRRVESYRIDYSDDGGIRWQFLDHADNPPHEDTMGKAGSARHYRVSALYLCQNDSDITQTCGDSQATVETLVSPASATIAGTRKQSAADAAPVAPAGFTAVADPGDNNIGATRINLSWETTDGVTWRIEYSLDGSTGWTTLGDDLGGSDTDDDGKTPYARTAGTTGNHNGLMADTTYYYRIFAVNPDDVDSLPAGIAAKTKKANKPGAPTNLVAVGGPGNITLYWDAPMDPHGAPVTSYKIEYGDSAVAAVFTLFNASTGSKATSRVHGNLDEDEAWYYKVWAINSAGTSTDGSNVAKGVAEAVSGAGRPAAPAGLNVMPSDDDGTTSVNESPGRISITWTAPAADSVDHHRIEWSPDGEDGNWQTLVTNTQTLTAPDATPYRRGEAENEGLHVDLTANTTYYYQIFAVKDGRESLPSTTATTKTTQAIVPAMPAGLDAMAVGTTINLSWKAPDDQPGAPVTGYRVDRQKSGDDWQTIERDTGTRDVTYSDANLEASTEYSYRVFAINKSVSPNRSGPSATAKDTTGTGPVVVDRTAPMDIVATVSGTTVTITWTDGDGADAHAVGLVNTADYSVIEADVANGVESHPFSNVPPGTYRPAVLALPGLDYLAFGPDSVTIPAGN